jgi:ribosome-associated protein
MENKTLQIVYEAVKSIDDKLGEDIRVLEIGKVSSICDYFVIASGSSQRQVKAISDEIEDRLAPLDISLRHKEGYHTGGWILMDYGDLVIHLFHEEDRSFYNIERVWKDANIIDIDNIIKNNI